MDLTAHPSDLDDERLHIFAPADDRLVLTGELDRMAADALHRRVAEVLRGRVPATLTLDVSGLSFLDSSGVRCLLACRRQAEIAGCRLVVADPAAIAYQVLEISGLLDHFGVERREDRSVHRSRPVTGRPRPA